MNCRHCGNELKNLVIDLGSQPPSNSYLSEIDLKKEETYFPLKVYVCSNCFLVQTADFTSRETFFNQDYAYFSSTSKTWLRHAHEYAQNITERFSLSKNSFVMEVASNDGYLLKNFVKMGIACLGIEPTESTASHATSIGVETIVDFYGSNLAAEIKNKRGMADLIVCNNVYAHVPDINDFTEALEISLGKNGVITIEFPHLLNLLEQCQFDTIYHEHYSYLSITTVQKIFQKKNLRIFDVEKISTHGGSVRIYGCKSNAIHDTLPSVQQAIDEEAKKGLLDLNIYSKFQDRAEKLN